MKRDVTRFGKRTRSGAIHDGINSVMRYYINNYVDVNRQIGIDTLLGYLDGTQQILGVKRLPIFRNQDDYIKTKEKCKCFLFRSITFYNFQSCSNCSPV